MKRIRSLLLALCLATPLPAALAAETGEAVPAAPAAEAEKAAPERHPALLDPRQAAEKAPGRFRVRFETTAGPIVLEVRRSWAPNGADRFYNLVKIGFFEDIAFFRVIPGFMAQFGIHGDPKVAREWQNANLVDDPVVESNTRGMVTYAKTNFPNSRSTQFFINFSDNSNLDAMGFAPFARVVEGMKVVDAIYPVGEGAPRGPGPHQGRIQKKGNAYLREAYPKLDYIQRAVLLD